MFPRWVRLRSLVLCSCFVLAAYISVWKWKDTIYDFSSRNKIQETTIYERRGKVVILLSQQRSGSSFVGEFFNRFENGFYLFEPLLPFTPDCSKLYSERLELLKQISHCDFRQLLPSYRKAGEVYRVKTHRECLKDHVCFVGNHPTLLDRYSNLCRSVGDNFSAPVNLTMLQDPLKITSELKEKTRFNPKAETCGYPLNLTLMSSLCHSARLVGYKILRVCSLSALENITRQLNDMGNEVYVVELVRDPRGIVNSALKLELKRSNLKQRLNNVCGRWKANMQYVEEQSNGKSIDMNGIVTSGRYMRVRYEDITMDPVKGAEKIYNHFGMSLPEEVKEWIEETSISPNDKIAELRALLADSESTTEEKSEMKLKIADLLRQSRSPYGTARDPQVVLRKWRKTLSMDIVNEIQEECGDVMQRLGYKLIQSEEEKNNMDLQLW